jgi:hypothetical protein
MLKMNGLVFSKKSTHSVKYGLVLMYNLKSAVVMLQATKSRNGRPDYKRKAEIFLYLSG